MTDRNRRKKTERSETRRGRRFTDAERGLKGNEAIREARRCLGTSECELCDVCALLCPDLCITRNESSGDVRIDLDYCKGCGICASVCPKGAIRMIREEGT